MKRLLFTISLFICSLDAFNQVHMQTGAAEITIPIYSFKDNLSRLKLNLSLNYSSGSGLLVDNVSGSVGTNWELSGIPKIIRIQKDLPDDQVGPGPVGIAMQTQFVGAQGCPKIMGYYPLWDNPGGSYDDPKMVLDDKRVDEFQLFLNGRLITFYLRTKLGLKGDGTSIRILNANEKTRITAYTDMPQGDNIACCTKITRFEVLDEDGVTYEFATREYGKKYSYNLPFFTKYLHISWRLAQDIVDKPYVTTAWSISRVVDKKNNKEINFEYLQQTLNFENFSNLYAFGDNSTYPDNFVGTIKKSTLITKEIKTIKFSTNERIEFSYNVSRKDVQGGYGLTDITIKKFNEERINRFILSQSYFVKNEIKIPANANEEKWSRFCLTSLKKLGKTDQLYEPPHLFTYFLGTNNSENFVAPVFFHAQDPWGYYNGDNCGVTVNNFLDKDATSLSDWIKLCTYNQNHYPYNEYEITNKCKTNYASNGLLKKYNNPYGGVVEFEYEQNKSRPPSGSGVDVIVGGVHVSKVLKSSIGDTEKQIIEYSYTLSDGTSSLWGVEQPRCETKITKHFKAETGGGLCYTWKYPGIYQGKDYSIDGSAPLYSFINSLANYAISSGASYLMGTTYGSGSVGIATLIVYTIEAIVSCVSSGEGTYSTYNFSKYPNNFLNPLPAQYSRVIVKNSSTNPSAPKIGKTEYEFTSDKDFVPLVPIAKSTDVGFNPFFFTQTHRSYIWMYGLPKSIKEFRYDPVSEKKVKEIENFYIPVTWNSHDDISLTSCNCSPVYLDSKKVDDYYSLANNITANFTSTSIPNKLYVDFCYVEAGYPQLTKTVETNYNSNGDNITNVINYEYNSGGLLKAQKAFDSKGTLVNKKIYYHNEFYDPATRPNNIFTQLFDQNRGNIPIATETWQTKSPGTTEELISSEIFEYGSVPNGDYHMLKKYAFESGVPVSKDIILEFSTTNPPQIVRNSTYIKQKEQIIYNEAGLASQINDVGKNKKATIIYGYDNQYVISSIINANTDEISYSSFETPEKNNWEYDNSRVVSNASCITGNKCFQLDWDFYNAIHISYYRPQQITKPYILSFWANFSTVLIGGNSYSPLPGVQSINGWEFYQIKFPTGSSVPIINGGGLIDELRWYPADARMSTYTYDPLIGKTSECDENNHIIYYNYDDLGRLQLVKDEKGNIVKAYEYNYKQ